MPKTISGIQKTMKHFKLMQEVNAGHLKSGMWRCVK